MADYVTQTSDKKKSTALILCCLGFIGIGGIHQFYVGNIGKGILYLFTGGLTAITLQGITTCYALAELIMEIISSFLVASPRSIL